MEDHLPISSRIEIGVGVVLSALQILFPDALSFGRWLLVFGLLITLHGIFPHVHTKSFWISGHRRFYLGLTALLFCGIYQWARIASGSPNPTLSARILITKMEIVPAGSLPNGGAPWSAVNVYFANFSQIPAEQEASVSMVLPISGTITADQADAQVRVGQDQLLSAFKWDELMAAKKGHEINKEDPGTFFSIPSAPRGDQADRVAGYFNSKEPNKRLYILVAIKYRDRSMGDRERSVTEGCGYFLGDNSPMHQCGRNQVVLEHF